MSNDAILAELAKISSRLSAIEQRVGVASASAEGERSRLAADFEASIINGPAKAVIDAAKAMGGAESEKFAAILSGQFGFALRVLDMAGASKKPAKEQIGEVCKSLSDVTKQLKDLMGRTAPVHIVDAAKGCEEGSQAFQWPVMDVGCADVVNNAQESCEFFHNKLRKASKELSKPELMAFANLYRDALKAMGAWVKDNAKMGIAWNPKGGDWKAFGGDASAATAAPAAAAPVPAPAPAAAASPALVAVKAPVVPAGAGAPAGGNLAGLFSQISAIDQSSGRTEGLKHVTKDMKAAAKAEAAATPVAPVKAVSKGPKETIIPGLKLGEPKVALANGLRWEVEFQNRDSAAATGGIITVDNVLPKQEVYIYGCRDCAIDVKGKVKGVRLDQCANVTVLVTSALSGLEVVNSRKMKVQVREKLPSVAIDKTDGIMVGLTWAARDAVITTSKSSEMNVTFPTSEGEDADWVEQPIPEQFVSKLTTAGKLHTTVSELYTS